MTTGHALPRTYPNARRISRGFNYEGTDFQGAYYSFRFAVTSWVIVRESDPVNKVYEVYRTRSHANYSVTGKCWKPKPVSFVHSDVVFANGRPYSEKV